MMYTARPTALHRAWEIVDGDGARTAYLPPPARPASAAESLESSRRAERRARAVASALTHLSITHPTVAIRDDGLGTLSAWDGPIRLVDVTYQDQDGSDPLSSLSGAMTRISAFVDGYIVARTLCLGEG